MFRHYLKVARRTIFNHWSTSLINLLGLTIGITSCLIIFRFIQYERSYDTFHHNNEHIFRVAADLEQEETQEVLLQRPPLATGLQNEFEEIVRYTRLILPWSGQAAASTLSWSDKQENEIRNSFSWGFYVDPGFLNVFSFPLIQGNPDEVLSEPNQIVLSESTATKIFGDDWSVRNDIIGQRIEYTNEFDRFQLIVTGVISDAPSNSHFEYDFLVSFETLHNGWAKDGYMKSWDGNGVYTYLQLAPGTSIDVFEEKMNHYYDRIEEQYVGHSATLLLQSLTSIHLHSHREQELKVNGSVTRISVFGLIALLILAIALMNYINLYTAHSLTRSREVGVRKVLGALKSQLIVQFLSEAIILNCLAFILAYALHLLLLPLFNQMIGLTFDFALDDFWPYIFLAFLIGTLASGLYPAFVMSHYHPYKALKGALLLPQNGHSLRKVLVTIQVLISACLILFTVFVYRQVAFMRNYDTGFEKNDIVVVEGPRNRQETWIEHDQSRQGKPSSDLFKDALSRIPDVRASTLSWSVPGEVNSIDYITLSEESSYSTLDIIKTDSDYATVYGLETLAGEFDTQNGHVINKSASQILGFERPEDAVGKSFKDMDGRSRKISGVIDDYHHHSLHEVLRPSFFVSNDASYKLDTYYSIKISTSEIGRTLEKLEQAFREVYPYDPFNYYFVDNYFDAQYQTDIQFGRLFTIFSGLAIFIACLGIFGLTIHTVISKTKEIGIRKVLGASVQHLVFYLNNSAMKWILIGSGLAFPLSYWLSRQWVSNYAVRIGMDWLFVLPILVVPLIVLITMSVQTIKAAIANPVDSLRNE